MKISGITVVPVYLQDETLERGLEEPKEGGEDTNLQVNYSYLEERSKGL